MKSRLTTLAWRMLGGFLVGMFAAALVADLGVVLCIAFGLQLPPNRQIVPPNDDIRYAAMFVIAGASVGTFAASMLGAILAPSSAVENEDVAKAALWTSFFGAIAGVWIGGGAGLVMYNLRERHYFTPADDTVALIAVSAGLIAGVAAAIVLRAWRNR